MMKRDELKEFAIRGNHAILIDAITAYEHGIPWEDAMQLAAIAGCVALADAKKRFSDALSLSLPPRPAP